MGVSVLHPCCDVGDCPAAFAVRGPRLSERCVIMASMPAAAATASAADVLARVIAAAAGADARPRPDQVRAVEELVDHRRRVLVVQATGWGKSAVYWGATAAMRERGAGPTLVVSPLLALMRDQIAAAERAGLRVATINS